jgi:hypothetical protein
LVLPTLTVAVGRGGRGAGPLGRDRDERAETGVEGLDPGQGVLDQLGGAHLPRPDGGGLFQRGEVVQLRAARRRRSLPFPLRSSVHGRRR